MLFLLIQKTTFFILFYQSIKSTNQWQQQYRRQACLDAVRNCRTKALSVAQYMNQTLGSALTVREENTTEMVGNSPTQEPNAAQSKLIYQQSHHSNDGAGMDTTKTNMVPIHQRIADATVSVYANVYVEFEVKERTRKVASTK